MCPNLRKSLTWEMLIAGRGAVEQMEATGNLVWKGLALPYSFSVEPQKFGLTGTGWRTQISA